MNRSARVLAFAAIVLALAAAVGCTGVINSLKARDQLNKGVASYKNQKYEEAIDHFQKAISLDPKLQTARLYLATAYAQQVVQGSKTPENLQLANSAINEFQKVLDENPSNEQKLSALKGIAMLYFNIEEMDKAKEYHLKVTQMDPNDPEAYYSVAVIDWTEVYKKAAEMKAPLGLKVDDPFKGKNELKVCDELRQANQEGVDQGIQMLQKALEIRPDYDDAMAYLNLLYRRRADLQCNDPAAREADLRTADDWVNKTLATKKMKAERQQAAGITLGK